MRIPFILTPTQKSNVFYSRELSRVYQGEADIKRNKLTKTYKDNIHQLIFLDTPLFIAYASQIHQYTVYTQQ
jgi:hypothetical protein